MADEDTVADQIDDTQAQLDEAKQDYADAETKEERAEARARAERMEAKLDQLIDHNAKLTERVAKVEATPVAPAPKPAEKPATAPATQPPASAPAGGPPAGSEGEKKRSLWWGDRG